MHFNENINRYDQHVYKTHVCDFKFNNLRCFIENTGKANNHFMLR